VRRAPSPAESARSRSRPAAPPRHDERERVRECTSVFQLRPAIRRRGCGSTPLLRLARGRDERSARPRIRSQPFQLRATRIPKAQGCGWTTVPPGARARIGKSALAIARGKDRRGTQLRVGPQPLRLRRPRSPPRKSSGRGCGGEAARLDAEPSGPQARREEASYRVPRSKIDLFFVRPSQRMVHFFVRPSQRTVHEIVGLPPFSGLRTDSQGHMDHRPGSAPMVEERLTGSPCYKAGDGAVPGRRSDGPERCPLGRLATSQPVRSEARRIRIGWLAMVRCPERSQTGA
jgi:hypothetical protein